VIADYPLSTLTPLPGMMPFEDIQFQLVDLPPIGNEVLMDGYQVFCGIQIPCSLSFDLTEDPDIQAEPPHRSAQRWNIHIRTRDEILQSPDKAL